MGGWHLPNDGSISPPRGRHDGGHYTHRSLCRNCPGPPLKQTRGHTLGVFFLSARVLNIHDSADRASRWEASFWHREVWIYSFAVGMRLLRVPRNLQKGQNITGEFPHRLLDSNENEREKILLCFSLSFRLFLSHIPFECTASPIRGINGLRNAVCIIRSSLSLNTLRRQNRSNLFSQKFFQIIQKLSNEA